MENNDLNEKNLIREISYNLSRNAGWIRFLGIVFIAYGALLALSIVGLLVAWIPIWMGILLVKAANKSTFATNYGDAVAFQESLLNLGNYFIINGIIVLLSIFVVFALAIAILFLGLSFDPEIFDGILS
jgi:hypothetical protein